MEEKILQATHYGDLKIGDVVIPCAVLEDGTRIVRDRGVATSLGYKGSGAHWKRKKKNEEGAILPEYVSAKNIGSFIDEETKESLLKTIIYNTKTGGNAQGISALLLPKICDIWLKAREKGALSDTQLLTAKKAEILMRGLATVGIIALIDEATGYQELRDKYALQEILDKYLLKEYAQWAKRFPDEFYELMFKLKGWQWKGIKVNRPGVVGKYTNDLVYERLAPNILEELRKRNPPNEKGRRKTKHHQWLTDDLGHPALQRHINMLIGLERASSNWSMFYRMVQRALPKCGEQIPINIEE